jgi:FlgN protein
MNYYEVLNLTEQQTANMIELNRIMHRFQKALIDSDILEFESTIDEQEKILNRIRNSETRRINSIKELLIQNNIPVDSESALDKLAELIADLDEEAYQQIMIAREKLFKNVRNVVLLNIQNEQLITNSRIFIRDLIKNLLGTRKQSFFDKKV